MPVKLFYKDLCKRYTRLPLDAVSLNKLRIITKKNFQVDTVYFNKKKYNKHTQLLDDILIREDYSKIEKLLNIIYKENSETSKWLFEFKNTNYLSLKKHWPQVHLINELIPNGDQRHLEEYNSYLKREKNEDISLIEFFGLNGIAVTEAISRIPSKESSISYDAIVEECKKLHKFLFTNQIKLTHLKILPFEALYPTNRFAAPLHITKRDKILKQKISYIKYLLEEFQPLYKQDLEHLVNFAMYNGKSMTNPNLEIQKNFFKHMIRKHEREKSTLNPLVNRFVRSKILIPNDNNIRKYLREYVRKQFYLEDNIYKMCWIQNFYENTGTNTYKLNTT